jgi:hypothetical protein
MRLNRGHEPSRMMHTVSGSVATSGAIGATSINNFFDFSLKKVEKSGDGKWHEVEDADTYGEEYNKDDRMVIGRALVLSKLEEAAMLRATT